MVCSRCGRSLNDIVVKIEQKLDVFKIDSHGLFLPIGNLSEPTHEYVCADCFDKYAECLNQLNEDYSGKFLVDMVEIVDDVQYGE